METKYVSTAETAKLIRAALNKAFPNVKFSVRWSRAFRRHWLDGWTNEKAS